MYGGRARQPISTHAPLAGRDRDILVAPQRGQISTHAPLAGRDGCCGVGDRRRRISTHAPLAGRDRPAPALGVRAFLFQPTRPLRGATEAAKQLLALDLISTHAPLAGRDVKLGFLRARQRDFNPRAPCGARRPLLRTPSHCLPIFQPTRPLRGATPSWWRRGSTSRISTHAPLAGRDSVRFG